MPTRKSNITLNLTDDDEPAVQQQLGEETAQEDADTADLPEYVTPPNPPGEMSSENVPESPIAAAMHRFTQQIEQPDEFTTTELEAIAVSRLHPDLSRTEVADRLDISPSTVGNANRRARLAELSEPDEIHATFRERTERQQTIIEAFVADPDCSDAQLSTLADCSTSGVETTKHVFAPLIRKLREVGFPDEYEPTVADELAPIHPETSTTDTTDTEPFACEVCGKTFDTANARNGHKAVHSNDDTGAVSVDDSATTSTVEIEPTEFENVWTETESTEPDDDAAPDAETTAPENEMVPRSELKHLRQFVDGLRDAAATEHSLTDDRVGHRSTAARQAVCETVLAKIDAVLANDVPNN